MAEKEPATLKSWILFTFGLLGMAYQQLSGYTDPVLLFIYTLMIGVPGFVSLATLAKDTPTASQEQE